VKAFPPIDTNNTTDKKRKPPPQRTDYHCRRNGVPLEKKKRGQNHGLDLFEHANRLVMLGFINRLVSWMYWYAPYASHCGVVGGAFFALGWVVAYFFSRESRERTHARRW